MSAHVQNGSNLALLSHHCKLASPAVFAHGCMLAPRATSAVRQDGGGLSAGLRRIALHACLLAALSGCRTQSDFDGDYDVDADDFVIQTATMNGPDRPPAEHDRDDTDVDQDGDVDLHDFAALQVCFAGPNQAPGAACLVENLVEPGTLHGPAAAPCGTCAGGATPDASPGIYGFSGEYYYVAEDLRIPGRGFDFVWARRYRSRIGPSTAMGNGWDFSYNIWVEAQGLNLVLHDGNSRRDLYHIQPDGTWARRESFREITQNVDGSYMLTFPDTGTWNLHALDGSPLAGKLGRIVDRNGNTMTFDYDGLGRLVTIHDTLDTPAHSRDISISYNADGFIAAVTDFTGRQVSYAYYHDGDAGGSSGDLKSATSPIVIGTPTGNDFPTGKTNFYTYSRGFADERLNHNLLTITDPKGQTYLQNVYATTTDPGTVEFDRVVRQVWGDPGDIIDFAYVPQMPAPPASYAIVKAIVNDRAGNVRECLYDAYNRLVSQREYTGRADPNLPTTETENRPTGRLRADDPEFFETRYEWNVDALPTRISHPNGNSTVNVYELQLDPDAPRRSRGNLRELHRLPGPLGGDQTEIIELFEYDTGFGGCCGTNFVTRHVDGREYETLHSYDAHGNRLHTQHRIPSIVEDWEYNAYGQVTAHTLPENGSGHRRRDEYTYYDTGAQYGYQQSTIVDAGGFALTTTYQYDVAGNAVRVTDPRGHDTQYVVNQLNQIVREISREIMDGSGVRYQRDTYYDADDNVVRVDVQNIDDQGLLQPNAYFTTLYDYEILNRLIRTSREVSDGLYAITEYGYDANRNRTLERFGQATSGSDPYNIVRTSYDERDLVFRETRAEGHPSQSTAQTDYDGNGNVRATRRGIEDASPRITLYTCDGYDRRTTQTDPMGNVTTWHYDANGNRISVRRDGELTDAPGSAGNQRLAEEYGQYDAMDTLVHREYFHFDTLTQAPIGDGFSTTQWVYSDNSQVLAVTDDNGHTTSYAYDTANRQSVVTDARGNTVAYSYDASSNIIAATEVDKSDLGNPDQSFVTQRVYDNLDRLIQTSDNVSNTHQYRYDSRDNLALHIDARDNQTRYHYDGLNRVVRTVGDMDADGPDDAWPGDGNPDIVTTQGWDDSSRLVAQTDDNGNTTAYSYDPLNRRIGTDYPDCTADSAIYDVYDNAVSTVDGNGSIVASTYDLLDRLTDRSITPGPGVSADTTFESYAYDGLSRLVRAQDNDSLVTWAYDSLSNVTTEVQQIAGGFNRTLNGWYDGEGNLTRLFYPGGRMIDQTYESLNRPRTVSDYPGSVIATFNYVGRDRVERRDYNNGTRLGVSYDGVRRIMGTHHTVIASGQSFDERTYAWDPMHNKTHGGVTTPPDTRNYTYDAANRLTLSDQITPPFTSTQYLLDGVGNREEVVGGSLPGLYTMDPTLCEPGDYQMNQYTTTPSSGSSPPPTLLAEPFDYPDGNLVGNGTWTAHSASGLYPVQVLGGSARLAQGAGSREDVNALLSATLGAGQKFYAAFDLTNTGGNGNVYFAHFKDAGTSNFASRVFITSNSLGDYTVGLSGTSGTIGATWPAGLTFGMTYRIVTSYEYDTGNVELWVDPISEASPRITHTGSVHYALSAYALRQATPSAGTSNQTIDDLCVADSFDGALNGLHGSGSTVHQYDHNGNLIDQDSATRTFTYDYRNQLVEFFRADIGQTTTYRYDCLGRRIEKNVGGTVTRFYYAGRQTISEQDGAGTTLATYVYSAGGRVPLQMMRGSQQYFYHEDDLGSAVKITDYSGAVVEGYSYSDFGEPSFFDQYGNPIGQSYIGNPWLFRGHRYDSETGFYLISNAVRADDQQPRSWYANLPKAGLYPLEFYSYSSAGGVGVEVAYMDTGVGRLVGRSAAVMWHAPGSLGNAYDYFANNPTSWGIEWSMYPSMQEGDEHECPDCKRAREARKRGWWAEKWDVLRHGIHWPHPDPSGGPLPTEPGVGGVPGEGGTHGSNRGTFGEGRGPNGKATTPGTKPPGARDSPRQEQPPKPGKLCCCIYWDDTLHGKIKVDKDGRYYGYGVSNVHAPADANCDAWCQSTMKARCGYDGRCDADITKGYIKARLGK
ncbi:MAG: RHS repeat protein [Phycisphaerae bacterium]|nr:RHS repeat protein [Phycisphaerae bacterium]